MVPIRGLRNRLDDCASLHATGRLKTSLLHVIAVSIISNDASMFVVAIACLCLLLLFVVLCCARVCVRVRVRVRVFLHGCLCVYVCGCFRFFSCFSGGQGLGLYCFSGCLQIW